MLQRSNGFREIEPLPKHKVAASLAAGWARIVRSKGKGTFADRAGTTERTVENALAGKTLPEGHTIFNSLAVDKTALDELFEEYGVRLVDKDAVCDTDNLGALSTREALPADPAEWGRAWNGNYILDSRNGMG